MAVKYRIVIEKWYNRWLRLLTMLLPGRISIALGSWHFGDFRNIFLPNIDENQKKSYDFSLGPLAGTVGVARGGAQGARAPPLNQNITNDKKLRKHSLAMFSCSFFLVITHIAVINHNINDNK